LSSNICCFTAAQSPGPSDGAIERDINRKRIKRELGGNIEKCRWGERLRAKVKLKDGEASHSPCAAGLCGRHFLGKSVPGEVMKGGVGTRGTE
jgi:hypothetical protein